MGKKSGKESPILYEVPDFLSPDVVYQKGKYGDKAVGVVYVWVNHFGFAQGVNIWQLM